MKDRAAYMKVYNLRHKEQLRQKRQERRNAICSHRKAWYTLHLVLRDMTKDERLRFFVRFLWAMKRNTQLVKMGVRS